MVLLTKLGVEATELCWLRKERHSGKGKQHERRGRERNDAVFRALGGVLRLA